MSPHPSAPHLLARVFGGILLCITLAAPAKEVKLNEGGIDLLEQLYQDYSEQFYLQRSSQSHAHIDNFTTLTEAVAEHQRSGRKIEAVTLITANLELLQKNVDSPAIINILTLLLEQNAWNSANKLFTTIQSDSNKTIVSNARYAMAKYYMRRNKWQKSIEYLDGIAGDLVTADADYANLMHGVALQQLKRHRKAIAIYEKSTSDSLLHPISTLNLAVAYIRQDWWTDAHAAINQLLKQPSKARNDELENRLNLILGYSLMRQGYYRNAREAFRNVAVNSQYTNQALIGIALTAIDQNNYIGALNAATILNNRREHDLPSEESYLLLPYIYSKLDQNMTASASYSSAIEHYQQEIQIIETALSRNGLFADLKIVNNQMLVMERYQFDITDGYPQSLIDNHRLISTFKDSTVDVELLKQLNHVSTAYNKALTDIARELLGDRLVQLNSYIAQARYGLALLYDRNLAE